MLTVVAYCRLSREDGDDNVSSSIVNQRKIIDEYAINNDMFVKDYYIDDGESGYTMDRPDFNRLKSDLNNDKVDTIIAKDLSRIGRHNAKVQLFLENIIESGKRLITIGDNYDSYNTQSHDTVGIQTWVNEKLVRDVSNKVRKAIHTMQKEGRYISSVPYGYYIDPLQKGVYHVDDTCAMYVKEMFDMYLNGLGINAIATEFTRRNIPTASMIAQQRLKRQGKVYRGSVTTKWYPNVVMAMLKNDFYIGTLTLGKTRKRSINGKKIKQPEESHYRFEHAHEPIIDEQTFFLAQRTIMERYSGNFRGKRVQERPNIFTGVLYCTDCGEKMTSTGNRSNTRYACKTYNMYGTTFCSSHSITESELTEALVYFLEHCRDNLAEAISDLDVLICTEKNIQSGDTIQMLQSDLAKVETEVKVLLEQKMRETINNPNMIDMIDKMYNDMINDKYAQINALKTQIQDQQSDQVEEEEIVNSLNNTLDIFDDIISSQHITKKQISILLDKIIVHDDGGLDIYLKGNLHELCTNYVQIKHTNKGKILQSTIEYIKEYADNITPTKAYEYIKYKGHHIGYKNYAKIFFILVDAGYLAQKDGYNKGYELTTSVDQLQDDFSNHIIDYDSTWVDNNSVDLNLIMKICKWESSLRYKKCLF